MLSHKKLVKNYPNALLTVTAIELESMLILSTAAH